MYDKHLFFYARWLVGGWCENYSDPLLSVITIHYPEYKH